MLNTTVKRFLSVTMVLSSASFAAAEDEITMHMEVVQTPRDVFAGIEAVRSAPMYVRNDFDDGEIGDDVGTGSDESGGFDVAIGKIVNTVKKVWDVIKENEPVLNVKYDYANAVPAGVRSGEDLENFSDLQTSSIRLYGKNLYGATVYDVTLSPVHQYGGAYKGRGQYLETVTLVPSSVNVLWGYTVDVGVTKVSVVNHGTAEAPVAGVVMDAVLKVSTAINKREQHVLYQFRGDSKTATSKLL